jgi:hypothetical protein
MSLPTAAARRAERQLLVQPEQLFQRARSGAQQEATTVNPATLLNQFTYGTLGRNVLRGPGAFNANLSLSKIFRLREAMELEFRVDAFNVFNNVEFGNPDTNIGDQSFGQISSTADPRIMQVALHLKF